jgi:hypothetical protein
MLKMQQKFIAGNYITNKMGKDFEWGVNDCNTFFIELHDLLYETDDLPRVKEKYSTRKGAMKFLKDLKLTPAQWLTLRDYKKLKANNPQYQDGDVLLLPQRVYSSVFFYFNGALWTFPEGKELRGYAPKAFNKLEKTVWRK